MKLLITIILAHVLQAGFSQGEVISEEIGAFCYIDSLSTKLVFNETCSVIKKSNFINVAFKSKYQFSIQEKDKETIYTILKSYSDYSQETSRTKLGSIDAIYCVGLTKTVNEDKTGFKLISGNDRKVEVYYHKGDLVLIFPKLINDKLKSPAHRVYIPKDCVSDFIKIFKL